MATRHEYDRLVTSVPHLLHSEKSRRKVAITIGIRMYHCAEIRARKATLVRTKIWNRVVPLDCGGGHYPMMAMHY